MRFPKAVLQHLTRLAQSWSREKDVAQMGALEHEIQFQFGCSWGLALTYANVIRVNEYFPAPDTRPAFTRMVRQPDGKLFVA